MVTGVARKTSPHDVCGTSWVHPSVIFVFVRTSYCRIRIRTVEANAWYTGI